MGRLAMAGALISVALGSALALPVAAQAASSAPAARIARVAASAGRHAVVPDIPPNGQWQFTGLTYPDTSAGLAACEAEGAHLVTTYHATDITYACQGAYQLWIYFVAGGI
jgi:hypothetical protein